MPGLPAADQAFVPPSKLAGYLLDPAHKEGWHKGRFLKSKGFDLADPEAIERALLAHGASHEGAVTRTPFGVKYEVDGPLVAPDGATANVRTVWMIDDGSTAPRFVTLRPL